MTLPTTTRHYQLTKVLASSPISECLLIQDLQFQPGTYKNLEVKEAPVKPPGAHEALVKVHAVSLQVS